MQKIALTKGTFIAGLIIAILVSSLVSIGAMQLGLGPLTLKG